MLFFDILYIAGCPNLELLASKSAKATALLEGNSQQDLSLLFRDIPADPETFELVARFCYGFEVQMSTENVVPLICLANYLEMTESHSTNNLLRKALTFFEQRVLASWNETVKAFRMIESILHQALDLGLVDACLESIIQKVLVDPRLLGEPAQNIENDYDSEDSERFRPNVRRRLFATSTTDWQSEDLTILSLQLYEPTIRAIKQHGVPSENISASIFQYARKWVLSSSIDEENMSIYKKNSMREIIEAMERLLPNEKGLLPCTSLFEMLRFAIALEASTDCRNGFEIRIGKQLDQATVKDLLIPSQGYAKEVQYDIESIRRILKNFYGNYNGSNISGLITVAELIEELLAEVASDIDLKADTFTSLAEMSVAASFGTHRNADGIYRAIDIYLDKHRYLTEMEREEVCRALDCQKMSPEACEHAAKNERLPLRFVVQVLFVAQLQLRDTITKEMQCVDDKLRNEEAEEELENEVKKVGLGEEEVETEMKLMSNKVMELERECHMMKKEIVSGCRSQRAKKGKTSIWKEMKRKLGCMSSIHDYNCQSKKNKVYPKYGV
ncbi:BTB/POZ domain-containing protein At3g03510-like [Tripterygium wilfordii]|uniref:BTB/POZ domain-containing protein At3g03510-like n=1 Tax=Tripterygium wilfordii TaxID=458696 RepID=UPI0018F84A30|nr:BTB/POZ domain-containing protein At3g03510-like [Tripterygium wilfordii]